MTHRYLWLELMRVPILDALVSAAEESLDCAVVNTFLHVVVSWGGFGCEFPASWMVCNWWSRDWSGGRSNTLVITVDIGLGTTTYSSMAVCYSGIAAWSVIHCFTKCIVG